MKTQKNSFIKSTFLVFVATSISKSLGLVREVLVAAILGVSAASDIFRVASFLPNSFIMLVGLDTLKGVSTTMFSESIIKGTLKKMWRSFSSVLNLVTILLATIVISGFAFSEELIRIFAPGFEGEKLATCVTITRILFPSLFFIATANYFGSILNSFKRFLIPPTSFALISIVVIAFIYVPFTDDPLVNLGVAFLIGYILRFSYQLFFLKRSGLEYSLVVDIKQKETKETFSLALPLVWTQLCYQVAGIVANAVASYFPDGDIAALGYAGQIKFLTVTTFINPFYAVFLPNLSEKLARFGIDKMKDVFLRSFRAITFVVLCFFVVLFVFGEQMISVLYERGAFDQYAVHRTARPLIWFSIELIFNVWSTTMIFGYLALKKNTFLTKIASTTFLIHIGFILILSYFFQYEGIAMAFALTYFVYTLALWQGLKHLIGEIPHKHYSQIGRNLFCTFLTLTIALVGKQTLTPDYFGQQFFDRFLYLALVTLGSFATYFLLTRLFRLEEATKVITLIREKLGTQPRRL